MAGIFSHENEAFHCHSTWLKLRHSFPSYKVIIWMLVYWSFNFQFFNVSVLMSLNFELYLENDNSQSLCSFIYQLARVLKWSVLVSVTSLISIAVLLSVIVPSQMPNQWQARNRGTPLSVLCDISFAFSHSAFILLHESPNYYDSNILKYTG